MEWLFVLKCSCQWIEKFAALLPGLSAVFNLLVWHIKVIFFSESRIFGGVPLNFSYNYTARGSALAKFSAFTQSIVGSAKLYKNGSFAN